MVDRFRSRSLLVDDHCFVGHLVPAVDLQVRDVVVADLEVRHGAEDGDEDDDDGRVGEAKHVVEVLGVVSHLLHPTFQLVLLTLHEAGLRLQKIVMNYKYSESRLMLSLANFIGQLI